jgi:hypothetical protein
LKNFKKKVQYFIICYDLLPTLFDNLFFHGQKNAQVWSVSGSGGPEIN